MKPLIIMKTNECTHKKLEIPIENQEKFHAQKRVSFHGKHPWKIPWKIHEINWWKCLVKPWNYYIDLNRIFTDTYYSWAVLVINPWNSLVHGHWMQSMHGNRPPMKKPLCNFIAWFTHGIFIFLHGHHGIFLQYSNFISTH